jgi:hypothetical protein
MRAHPLFCVAISLMLANSAHALELFWPTGASTSPCGNTLQNCVNSTVPGRADVVTIVDDPIDIGFGVADGVTIVRENILINRDMTLRAAPNVQAIFTGNNGILMTLSPNQTGAVRDLTLTNGQVRLEHIGADLRFATYIVEGIRISAFRGLGAVGAITCAIQAFGFQESPSGPTGTFGRFIIRKNHIDLFSVSPSPITGICLNGNRLAGSAAKSEISMNRITADTRIGTIGIETSFDSGAVEVRRNRIVGAGGAIIDQLFTAFISGALHEQVISHNVAERFDTAITAFPASGSVTIAHNTLVCPGRGAGTGVNTSYTASESVQVRIVNNLVSRCGIGVIANAANSVNSNNLIFSAIEPFRGVSPGPGTLFVDPLFESATYYRPSNYSPAVNAGIADAAVAGFDVEGNRQPNAGAPDIGAFEQVKDIGMRERFSGGAPSELLAQSGSFLFSSDHPIATPLGGAGYWYGQLEQAHALWFDGNNWLLRLGTAPLAAGRQFNIMAPRNNHAHFLHTPGLAGNAMNHPSVNNQPQAVVIVNERFDRADANAMDGNPVGVYYSNAYSRWFVGTENQIAMSAGARFNVMVGSLESGVSFSTRMPQAAPKIALRHPALDDNPCAVFTVGRRGSVFNPQSLVVNYVPAAALRPGRWQIEQPSGFNFPAGAEFNVIIDGTASERCRANPPS